MYCWSYARRQAGDSTIAESCDALGEWSTRSCGRFVPTRILPESLPGSWPLPPRDVRFEQVDVGEGVACGVSTAGVAYCWGRNDRCALGRCRTPLSYRAHLIAVPGRVVEIGAGGSHACARTTERRVYCWGDNLRGQLGSLVSANAGADRLPPDYRDTTDLRAQVMARREDPCFDGGRCSPAAAEVEPRRRWSALTVGGDHACALAEDDGGIYCWGGTDTAALGGGDRLVPCENRSHRWEDVRCQPMPVRVAGLPRLVARRAPAAGRGVPVAVAPPDLRGTRVRVSRREVRVVFPPETDGAWGWPGSSDSLDALLYRWSIFVTGTRGPRELGLFVVREGGRARDFPSLEGLVAAGRVEICSVAIGAACTDSALTASVDSGRVVLVLRDSARIAELFGLRPDHVRPIRSAPEEPFTLQMDRVRVEYVAPQIRRPTAAFRAEVERRLRPPPSASDRCVGRMAITVGRGAPTTGPAVVHGRVHRDSTFDQSRTMIAGANVHIAEFNLGVGTAADGTYELRVPPERLARPESVTVRVRSIGYRPLSRSVVLRQGSQVRLDASLCPELVRLSHD